MHGNVIGDYDNKINIKIEAFYYLQLPMDPPGQPCVIYGIFMQYFEI